jgi:intracellular septation protein A
VKFGFGLFSQSFGGINFLVAQEKEREAIFFSFFGFLFLQVIHLFQQLIFLPRPAEKNTEHIPRSKANW